MTRDATADRRDQLALTVAERGFLRVGEASTLLGVSEVTIRGDLTALEQAGLLVRVHGGAMPRTASASDSAPSAEPTLEQAQALASETKTAIGVAAAALVSPGQSVILDVGSTALAVAHALVARTDLVDVTVITNGLSIALALEPALPRFTVVVTGGTLRPLQHSLVNPSASAFFDSVHADIAFIGCNGIDAEHGVTNINFPEAEVKHRMVQSSARRVLIADASKLDQTHFGVIGPVDEFQVLVTGGIVGVESSARLLSTLAERGIDVIVADSGQE